MSAPCLSRVRSAWVAVLACSVGLFACIGASSQDEDYQAGYAAYLAGDYEKAMNEWMPRAESPDPRVQFGIGTLFYEGKGVEREPAASAHWFQLASEKGYAPAQFNLGNAYKHGEGVEQDDQAANLWWSRAAAQDFAPAQFNLGTQYYFGHGVPEDREMALVWYRKAAENGHRRAAQVLVSTEARIPSRPAGQASPSLGGREWVESQSPGWYTLQVIASPNRDTVMSMLGETTPHRGALLSFHKDGRTWYAALLGSFASRQEAVEAVAELPARFKENVPWVRRFSDLQSL